MENKTEFVPDKEMLDIWLEDLLYECGKNSVEELTPKEIEEAIEETRGTISNERLWAHADAIHWENIANLEAYISELEELLEKAKGKTEELLVKSEVPYAPQNYVGLITGNYYFFKHHEKPEKEISQLLRANNKQLRSFPLNRIDLVVKLGINVVLVDCSYYKDDKFVTKYMWWEVDCEIPEDDN